MTICKRFIVFGRVQGVWYRAATRERALELGLIGYAKNLPDGSVEVLAQGASSAVEELEAWLWQGPAAAEVADVRGQIVEDPLQLPESFTTG